MYPFSKSPFGEVDTSPAGKRRPTGLVRVDFVPKSTGAGEYERNVISLPQGKAMSDLEKTRNRIQKIGKAITIVSTVVMVISMISVAVHLVTLVVISMKSDYVPGIYDMYSDNALYRLLSGSDKFQELSRLRRAQLGLFVVAVTQLALFSLFLFLRRMMNHLAKGGRPFDAIVVKRMRKSAFIMLLICLYSVPAGVLAFVIALLFSYIMEYGGYIQERADETNRIQEEIIMSFAEITENKSGQTGQHIKRVSEYSRVIASQLGMPSDEVEMIRIASTMHDIGKLLIPGEILEKPGRLTDEEFEVIKKHTTYGGQLLQNVEGDEMKMSKQIALEHHERYDGHGYPFAMVGDDISIEGRIVAVADVYDALTSRRSYKEAWAEEDAYNEIMKGRGTQFDPDVVDAFAAAHDEILKVKETFRD